GNQLEHELPNEGSCQNAQAIVRSPAWTDAAQACAGHNPADALSSVVLLRPSFLHPGDPMYTMILLLYLQSGLDVTLDQANLRGEFRSKAACEDAAAKLRGPIPIPRNVQAAWQDVMCIKLNPNVQV